MLLFIHGKFYIAYVDVIWPKIIFILSPVCAKQTIAHVLWIFLFLVFRILIFNLCFICCKVKQLVFVYLKKMAHRK